jgi:hypothetical protein
MRASCLYIEIRYVNDSFSRSDVTRSLRSRLSAKEERIG